MIGCPRPDARWRRRRQGGGTGLSGGRERAQLEACRDGRTWRGARRVPADAVPPSGSPGAKFQTYIHIRTSYINTYMLHMYMRTCIHNTLAFSPLFHARPCTPTDLLLFGCLKTIRGVDLGRSHGRSTRRSCASPVCLIGDAFPTRERGKQKSKDFSGRRLIGTGGCKSLNGLLGARQAHMSRAGCGRRGDGAQRVRSRRL